jgi:hypothetical protein
MLEEKRPTDQECFRVDPWKEGNTGKTKNCNYNNDFIMKYRVVYIKERLMDKIKHPLKNEPEAIENQGGRDTTMGLPYKDFDLDPVQNKLTVFPNLPSIRAVRKDKPSLNIAYDCEYQSIKNGERVILSYQFALYLDDDRILEICFISRRLDKKNRLYLRTCIGAILDLLRKFFGKQYVNYGYSSTRRYCINAAMPLFEGSDERYFINRENMNESEMKTFVATANPLIIADTGNIKRTNNFKNSYKYATSLTIVCHTSSVDLSAFKDDLFGFRKKGGSILPYLKSMQGGTTSIYPYKTNIPSASEYWKFYPVGILFRDTMCYAPADKKSLEDLGESIEVPKIKLAREIKLNMQSYLLENPYDFLAYAAQDALVTLMYGSRLWGVNTEWCLTTTSGSAFIIKESIASYMNIPRDIHGNINQSIFESRFRGMKSVDKGKISTPSGLRPVKAFVEINYLSGQLHRFAEKCYCGGFNTCSLPGVFQSLQTFDFDLKDAYSTAMCLIIDIDFENPEGPIGREFKNETLTLQAFHSPVDPMFCLVDFEFPDNVKYPCIAIHEGGSIIFPRKAESVYAPGPSLYLALKMGAKIKVKYGYIARIKINENEPSMSLRNACKQMVNDRMIAKKIYGPNSIEEILLKLFVVGSYGKISQDVIQKNTWDGWNEYMEDIGSSSITSPERASLITDIVRCMLIGTMNQLHLKGINTYSVTTDGFITEATMDQLNECDCYGFRSLFEMSRLWLTNDDPTIWSVKHDQITLINPLTRCNIGFGGTKGVLAHGGIVTGELKDSEADRHRMAELVLTRKGKVESTTTEFMSIKEMQKNCCDFYTFEKTVNKRLDFDMKRKPIKDSFVTVKGNIYGIDYEYTNFDTEAFETVDEYIKYRKVNESFDCIRTFEEWQRFFLKLEDRENEYKRDTSNLDWTKLFSVVQGYRMGLWDIPVISACETVREKLAVINKYNHSSRVFNENAWTNSRKPERASQMIPREMFQELLEEFGYKEYC